MLLFFLACAYSTTCERVETEVADDDPLGDLPFTVGELVTAVEGVRSFPATGLDGSVVTATLSLARGDGAPVFSDGTWVTDRSQLQSTFSSNDMLRTCEDSLEVPLDLTLTTDDGAFDLAGDASARADAWGDTTEGLGAVSVAHTVDGDALPANAALLDAGFEADHLVHVDVVGEDETLFEFPPVMP